VRGKTGMYKHFFKRLIDIILSLCGIIVLAIPMLIIAVVIKITDPGPVLFKQKRVGIRKNGELTYFSLLKFRSMKMNTPHNVPTHMLENPEQYITRIGAVLRKTSGDELPQIYNILIGQMSIIGPRPALWNQDDLIAERDKYGANDIKPGLTGWAQVNGRDELEIEDKARLDGEYTRSVSLKMDWLCFWMTVGNVLKHRGVVEGGTGVMVKQIEKQKQSIDDESSVVEKEAVHK